MSWIVTRCVRFYLTASCELELFLNAWLIRLGSGGGYEVEVEVEVCTFRTMRTVEKSPM